jgi:hypothetical protein
MPEDQISGEAGTRYNEREPLRFAG